MGPWAPILHFRPKGHLNMEQSDLHLALPPLTSHTAHRPQRFLRHWHFFLQHDELQPLALRVMPSVARIASKAAAPAADGGGSEERWGGSRGRQNSSTEQHHEPGRSRTAHADGGPNSFFIGTKKASLTWGRHVAARRLAALGVLAHALRVARVDVHPALGAREAPHRGAVGDALGRAVLQRAGGQAGGRRRRYGQLCDWLRKGSGGLQWQWGRTAMTAAGWSPCAPHSSGRRCPRSRW